MWTSDSYQIESIIPGYTQNEWENLASFYSYFQWSHSHEIVDLVYNQSNHLHLGSSKDSRNHPLNHYTNPEHRWITELLLVGLVWVEYDWDQDDSTFVANSSLYIWCVTNSEWIEWSWWVHESHLHLILITTLTIRKQWRKGVMRFNQNTIWIQIHYNWITGNLTFCQPFLLLISHSSAHRFNSNNETPRNLNSQKHGGRKKRNKWASILPRE